MSTKTPVYDFYVRKRFTKRWTLVVEDDNGSAKDLTDYTCRMSIRSKPNETPYLTLDSEEVDGGITITPATGTIDFEITSAQTETFPFSEALYDVRLSLTSGDDTPLLCGKIIAEEGITAAPEA